jgi:acrylyl-CoA reductase (NADPH)
MPLRLSAWRRLADDLDRGKLASLTTHAPFERVLDVARDIVEGKVRGRVVIDVA